GEIGYDGRSSATGGEANPCAYFRGDSWVSREVSQCVRAAHGNYSEGKVEQTHRIRKAGPGTGGREPSHQRVSGVRRTSQRSGIVGASGRSTSAAVRKGPATGGG